MRVSVSAVGRTAAYPRLVAQRPGGSLMSPVVIFSLLSQICIQVLVQLVGVYYVRQQPWWALRTQGLPIWRQLACVSWALAKRMQHVLGATCRVRLATALHASFAQMKRQSKIVQQCAMLRKKKMRHLLGQVFTASQKSSARLQWQFRTRAQGAGKTRTHCGGNIADVIMFPKCWLVLPRTHKLCGGHKFCVLNTKIVSENLQKHFLCLHGAEQCRHVLPRTGTS